MKPLIKSLPTSLYEREEKVSPLYQKGVRGILRDHIYETVYLAVNIDRRPLRKAAFFMSLPIQEPKLDNLPDDTSK